MMSWELNVAVGVLNCFRYIKENMLVEVGKGISPNFQEVLEVLHVRGEFLAFAPDTKETRMMINFMSIKFPLLQVPTEHVKSIFVPPNKDVLSKCGYTCAWAHYTLILSV